MDQEHTTIAAIARRQRRRKIEKKSRDVFVVSQIVPCRWLNLREARVLADYANLSAYHESSELSLSQSFGARPQKQRQQGT